MKKDREIVFRVVPYKARRARRYKNPKRGKATRLGMMDYWAVLFAGNEMSSRHCPDEVLLYNFLREFPDSKSRLKFINGTYSVNDMRTRYNRGVMSQGVPPPIQSFRYDDAERIVNFRTGTRELTDYEIVQSKPFCQMLAYHITRRKLHKCHPRLRALLLSSANSVTKRRS